MLHFRLLGPFEVVGSDAEPVELGPPQQRALLALLTLWSPGTAAVDEIIDALWHTAPPSTARNLVQVYVSRLRKTLQVVPGVEVVTRPPGYALEIEPDAVDARRFERLATDGRRPARPQERAARLADALSLWRGQALADLARFEFLVPEITRLTELRLDTDEARLAAELESGRHAEILVELEQFTSTHPLREGAWVLLMRALYRSGRQAEALRAYDRIRSQLLVELGVDPIPELQELHQAILVHDPALVAGSETPGTAPTGAPPAGVARAVPEAVAALGPAVLPIRPGSAFFRGRGAQVARLVHEYGVAGGGGVRIALVAGEAGIGKSRLVAEAVGPFGRDGAVVLAGASRDGSSAPFEPVVLALGPMVAALDHDELRRLCGSGFGALARLLPTLGAVAPEPVGDPEAERFALLETVDELLAHVGRYRPVVLVLDDLHWVDAPTVLLLGHLSRSARQHRLLVVGAYRDDEIDETHPLRPLLADLRRHRNGSVIELGGLEEVPFSELVAELSAGRSVVDPGSLYLRTAGNPLFAEYLLEQSSGTLPQGIADLVGERLQRLDADVLGILQVAAIAGQEFDTEVVGEAAEVSRMDLLEAVDAAIVERVVVETDRPAEFAFRHAVIREALVDRLTSAREAVLHWRVGEAMCTAATQRGTSRDEVARHLAAGAAAGDPARALTASLEAGEEADGMLAYETAHDHYVTALQLTDRFGASPDVRWEVLTHLGRSEQILGNERGWRRAFGQAADLARANGWPKRLVEAALGFAFLPKVVPGQTDGRLLGLVDEALAVARPHSGAHFRLLSIRTQQLLAGGELDVADTLLDETLVDARRSGDHHAVIGPLEARTYRLLGGPQPDELVTNALELLLAADRAGDSTAKIRALVALAVGRLQTADRPGFDRVLDQLHDATRHRGSFEALVLDATVAAAEGDLDRSEELSTLAVAAGPDDTSTLLATGVQSGFNVPIERDRIDRAAENARLFIEFMPELPAAVAVAAGVAWLTGDDDEVRLRIDQLIGADVDRLPQDWTRPLILSQLVEPVVGLGDTASAEMLANRLRPYTGQLLVTGDGVGIEGAADRFLGSLASLGGMDDRTAALFLAAIRLEDHLGLAAHSVRSRVAYARALLGRRADSAGVAADDETGADRRQRAASLLQEAGAEAARLGLARLEKLVAALAAGDLSVR